MGLVNPTLIKKKKTWKFVIKQKELSFYPSLLVGTVFQGKQIALADEEKLCQKACK